MDLREAIVAKAKELLGTPYSKLDCSAYVRQVFRNWKLKGLYKNELPRVSATQAKTLNKMGIGKEIPLSMSVADVVNKLKKGDLVWWWSKKSTSRWLRIHHVGIYDKDGYVFESSSSEGKVVRRKLWESTSWQITYIADITSLIESDVPIESEEEEVINKNSSVKTIARAQQALITIGFGGSMNPAYIGQWGSKTEAAVKAFQKHMNLSQTGVIDAETAGALFEAQENFFNTDIATLEATINNDKIALKDIADRANSRL